MMGPWFVELLARNGDVLQRQCVDKLPIRIGRDYGNDVILDDDYAAPSHAIVEPDAAGHLILRDLGSKNGIVVAGKTRVTTWAGRSRVFETAPLELRVIVTPEGDPAPPPAYRAQGHLMCIVSDDKNVAVSDYNARFAFCFVNSASAGANRKPWR